MVISRTVDKYLTEEERSAAAWRVQWKEALEGTAGLVPYFDEGAEYVEDVRRSDAERLGGLDD
jgi:hypothetical protein